MQSWRPDTDIDKDDPQKPDGDPRFRVKAGLASEHILRIRRAAREAFDFSSVEFEVFLTVCLASLDRVLRDPRMWDLQGPIESADSDDDRPLSARAVCQATGLNRETVRRAINALTEKEWVARDHRGYFIAASAFARPENLVFFREVFSATRDLCARWTSIDGLPEGGAGHH